MYAEDLHSSSDTIHEDFQGEAADMKVVAAQQGVVETIQEEIKATKAKIDGIEAKIEGIEAAMKFKQAEIQSGKVKGLELTELKGEVKELKDDKRRLEDDKRRLEKLLIKDKELLIEDKRLLNHLLQKKKDEPPSLEHLSLDNKANTYELANTSELDEREILWYNLCPTLSKDQIRSLARNYDPTAVNPFDGVTAEQIAKATKIDVAKCKQILKLLTPNLSLTAPSKYGVPSTFMGSHSDSCIYYPPFRNCSPCAPLSLVSKPIIAFQEALANFNLQSEDVVLRYKGLAVQFLLKMGTQAFTYEYSMYPPLLECFRNILSSFKNVTVERWSTPSLKGKPIETDGTVMVNNTPCIVLEAKRFDLTSKANPVMEAIGYFQYMINSNGAANLTCALLIAITGDLMSIYGCHAFVDSQGDKQLLVELLCPPISLRFNESISWHLDYIASVLYGFVCFVEHISKDAPKLEFCPLTLAKILQKFSQSFTPTKPLRRMCPDKLVFEFDCKKEDQKRELVVKFVKGNYGEEVHEHLSSYDYAPKLYELIKLPLNWKAVVMERLLHDSSMPSDYTAQLMSIVKCLHEKKYVHGDLRKPNILNVKGKLQICDFDWAGEEGVARYPFDINHRDIKWPRENLPGKKIVMADDDFWICQQ